MVISSCAKFVLMHSCTKPSSSLTDVTLAAVVTFELVDNIPSVVAFERFL